LDFRHAKPIGERIDAPHVQLRNGSGYDHNWVLTDTAARGEAPAACLRDPTSGRSVTVYTQEPGIQCYTGNFLDGSLTGKNGAIYERWSGVALETQHFPDSPNQPAFPSVRLDPGEVYQTRTVFEFGR
jgi:aldose 1-epimerase